MFEAEKCYENYKGVYEVLSIEGESMRIRWDETGEEIDTSIGQQSRILRHFDHERNERAKKARGHSSAQYGTAFDGLSETDFREDTAGTHWRSREQLGGAVTKHLCRETTSSLNPGAFMACRKCIGLM